MYSNNNICLYFLCVICFTPIIDAFTVYISNCDDLQAIQTNTNSVYYMVNDIDCSNNTNFVSIGNSSIEGQFMGTLCGCNYSISSLNIATSHDNNYMGLFAYISKATIRDIYVKNVNVSNNSVSYIGIFCGRSDNSTIYNCHISNTNGKGNLVSDNNLAEGPICGGFCGIVYNTNISGCTIQDTAIIARNFACFPTSGGICGSGSNVIITNSYNLGNRNTSISQIVGYQGVGGLIGQCICCTIIQCGVSNITIVGNYRVGGIVGCMDENGILDQVYVSSTVYITLATTSFCGDLIGGIVGYLCPIDFKVITISNSYSKCTLNVSLSLKAGAIIGEVFLRNNSILNLSSCYTLSTIVPGTSTCVGSIIGSLRNKTASYNVSFYNVYFSIQKTMHRSIGISYISINNSSNNTISCFNSTFSMIQAINETFLGPIWNGNSLSIEYAYNSNNNNSMIYNGCIYYTNISSTQLSLATTTIITTAISTTEIQTSMMQTSNIQTSTQIPTVQSTQIEISSQIQTELSTQITSFVTLNSTLTNNCYYYDVPNCENCISAPLTFSSTQSLNVSCSFIIQLQQWNWVFENTTSNSICIQDNQVLTINGSNYIQGNLNQSSLGILQFILGNNTTSSVLHVSHCVSLNGTLELVLNVQPLQGNSSFILISYNCSQNASFNANSIIATSYNYPKSECDRIHAQLANSQDTISVSLTSSLGVNCMNTLNIKLIIALSVVIPVALLILVSTMIFLLRCKLKRDAHNFHLQIQKNINMSKI